MTTPVAIGEALRNRYGFFHRLTRRAQPAVTRARITETVVIADPAHAHHVRIALHHSVGLGVALAARLQLAAATESL